MRCSLAYFVYVVIISEWTWSSLVKWEQLRTLIASRLPVAIIKIVLLSPNDEADVSGIGRISLQQPLPLCLLSRPIHLVISLTKAAAYGESSPCVLLSQWWRRSMHQLLMLLRCHHNASMETVFICHSSSWRLAWQPTLARHHGLVARIVLLRKAVAERGIIL